MARPASQYASFADQFLALDQHRCLDQLRVFANTVLQLANRLMGLFKIAFIDLIINLLDRL
ncbi:uncharacterized protein Dmul_04700 [Desulfococcus multivorans]|nr:uncharacterized protein Dmul_04700 [Desulfococcus multivorans]